VRRVLAEHPWTRKEFAAINVKRQSRGPATRGIAVATLNAKLLPLYRRIRKSTQGFWRSEREYIRLRANGVSITAAGKRAFTVSAFRAMSIERCFLEKIIPPRVVTFPEPMPLPPFLLADQIRMQELGYERL
ncbi:MAG: hypothetical protein KDD60_06810, partial [Bdellovibrionales bacterium]|nr:hypothetical protein [Bdellovibrionales bacterium]